MENRPAVWNGIEVPYGASVDELARGTEGPAPARWAAFVALAHTPGDSALAVLRDNAASSDPHLRRIAVEAIGVHREGGRLGPVVRTLLSDTHAFVVRSACEAAGRRRLVEAHDSIVRLLDADDDSTRVVALRALRELWQESDFEQVFQAFTADASGEVRKEAAWTLRSVASSANWRPLFALWRVDPLPRHREWACELATAYGSGEVLPEVRHLTDDADGHVRYRAAQAVRELEARGLTPISPPRVKSADLLRPVVVRSPSVGSPSTTAESTPDRVLHQCCLRFQRWPPSRTVDPTPIEAQPSRGDGRGPRGPRGLETHAGPRAGLLMTSDVARARPLSPGSGEGQRLR